MSENSSWNVLLIEAGADETVFSDIPLMMPTLQKTSMDWQFQTEPSENYCKSMNKGRCNWPRGKVLGGSSVLNAMLYVRGNRRDYDRWAQLGNSGWSYQEVLPYFIKSEDCRIDELRNSPYRGKGGPIKVERMKFVSPITHHLMHAAKEMGLQVVDFNGEQQSGVDYAQATLDNGLRCSSAKAYLRKISRERKNLDISLRTHVTKVRNNSYL